MSFCYCNHIFWFSGNGLRKLACSLIQFIVLNTNAPEQLPWNWSVKELKAHIEINVVLKYQRENFHLKCFCMHKDSHKTHAIDRKRKSQVTLKIVHSLSKRSEIFKIFENNVQTTVFELCLNFIDIALVISSNLLF